MLGLGLLRTILAVSVVIPHSSGIFGYNVVGGMVAVQSFYIISGFYMSLILNEKYTDRYVFYTNRILRLYPIYLVVAFLTLLMSYVDSSNNGDWNPLFYYFKYYEQMGLSTLIWLVFSNLALIGQDVVMFLGLDTTTGAMFFTTDFHKTDPMLWKFLLLPQAWTLSVEITFYLLAPWIVKRNTKLLIVLLVLALGLRFYIYEGIGLKKDPWNYRFFPIEIALFLMGAIAYKLYVRIKSRPPEGLLPAALFVLFLTLVFQFIPIRFIVKQWVYYFVVMFSIPYLFVYSKNSRIDRRIGELSYGIYISHVFVISLMTVISHEFVDHARQMRYLGAIVSLFSVVFAVCLYKYVQVPIDRYREGRINGQPIL